MKKNVEIMNSTQSIVINLQWLQVCLWTLIFEIVFICHVLCDCNTQQECSRLCRNVI